MIGINGESRRLGGTAVEKDSPLTIRELLLAGALVVVGLALAAAFRVYDANGARMALALNAASAVFSFALLWIGLATFRVPTGRRTAAAVIGLLPWNTFLLSQIAYVGFFMIPIEIVASSLILHSRARLRTKWAALVVAATTRLLLQLFLFAVRPAARALFPWR